MGWLKETIPEDLAILLKGGKLIHIPTVTGWSTALVGSGGVSPRIGDLYVQTGATASSSALAYALLTGFNANGAPEIINWAKKLYYIFNVMRHISDAQTVARVQITASAAVGALTAKGIGLQIDNFALTGESYGTSRGTVDLATTLGDYDNAQITIIHYPGSKVEFLVNGVLKGTISTAAYIPSTTSDAYLATSIANGDLSSLSTILSYYHPKLWQER